MATLPVGNPMKRLWQRISFTLVEMLAVVVIIGMLVVAGIPAFMRIASSGSLNSSLRQVSNAMSLARQYAITQRTTTRVIFPSSATTTPASGRSFTNMAYVSFAVLSSNRAVSGIGAWSYVSKWEYLPMGSVFVRSPSPASGYRLDYLSTGSVPITNGDTTGVTMNYVEFQPTGAATPQPYNYLMIREGFVTNALVAGAPSYFQSGSGGGSTTTPKNAGTITVDSMIGHISVSHP